MIGPLPDSQAHPVYLECTWKVDFLD